MRPTALRAVIGAATVALAVAACGSTSSTSSTGAAPATQSPTTPAASSPAPQPSATTDEGAEPSAPPEARSGFVQYADYAADPAAFSAGPVVLFFHAGWCPKCQETKANLTTDPASLGDGVTVVEVDFDSENELRQRYGVTVQHTFVQVDGAGEKIAIWTGTFTGEDITAKVV